MPVTTTRDFGPLEYQEEDILSFPRGLPGFPDCRRFLSLKPRPEEPLIMLQCLDQPEIAFVTLPVETLTAGYQLRLLDGDRRVLAGAKDSAAEDWTALAIVTLAAEASATVNLLGPVVIDRKTKRGVQAVRDDARYGAAEPLEAWLGRAEAVCS